MKLNKDGWSSFIKACLSAKKPEVLEKLLHVFLTAEEKKSISTRCLIIKALLEQQNTQRAIAKDLKVSIAKITRGSNELKRQDLKLLNYLKKYL